MNSNQLNRIVLVSAMFAAFSAAQAGQESLRVVTWNISEYSGGRTADIQNAVYGSYNGRSMRPDVIMAQEIQSASAATSFLAALNSATGGPKDWAASYKNVTGTSSSNDQVTFYRTSKLTLSGTEPHLVRASQGTSGTPRDVYRWDYTLVGDATKETLSFYDVHLKAGDASSDDTRRLDATRAIRDDANSLSDDHHVIIGGDFNVQRSTQGSYQALTESEADNSGRFFDPINTPGSWNNNASFRYVHTQDPTGPGGMDDRYDQILLDGSLLDGKGLDYVGDSTKAYSTTTWDDPNHSYRAWGNDGTSFNTTMTINGNAMVGSSIAQSLANVATSAGGHLPVFLDLRYSTVPEPASLAVLGLGFVAILRRRR